MIEVQVRRDEKGDFLSFQATGHADYAPHGEDIVCAAVSALVQTTVLGLAHHVGIKPEIKVKAGYLRCNIPENAAKKKAEVRLLLEVMLTGLREIKKEYPKYLELKEQ